MYTNNEVSTIEPIKELTTIAHKYGAAFHTDAVQAVGHIPIDVKELDVDMLSASAHKFNGPKGIGFLYVKQGYKLNPYVDGGSQESGMRAGTENIASIIGMATALKINVDQMAKQTNYLMALEQQLLARLSEAKLDYHRNGSPNHVYGNISLSFKGVEGESLLHRLDLKGICVSTGSACDSKDTHISHVLRAMHMDEEYAQGTIRISLGKNNSIEDVNKIATALINIIH